MMIITKLNAPQSLVLHRSQSYSDYDNMPRKTKEDLKRSLLQEQGYLCCYCMGRIDFKNMRLEHWQCQSRFRDKQLDYNNLMAACWGNDGELPENRHCDVRKGDADLIYNPSDIGHQSRLGIRYLADGIIQAQDSIFNAQLESVLNLNYGILKANRKKAYEGAIEVLQKVSGRASKDSLQRKMQRLRNRDNEGKFTPYLDVALYFLNKKLERYQRE